MILIKTIHNGELPTRQTSQSAGFDVCARMDVEIEPMDVVKIPLGIAIDDNRPMSKAVEYLELHPRSSMRANGMIAQVGLIDSDFRGEIQMIATSLEYMKIKAGDRVGQIVIRNTNADDLRGCLTKESERSGGFGSTGK